MSFIILMFCVLFGDLTEDMHRAEYIHSGVLQDAS